MSNISDHVADIDFRSREVRQASKIEDFTDWYLELSEYSDNHDYDPWIQGQLTMLSSMLWYLLPERDYKKLTRRKK